MFANCYKGRRVFITGHTGFKGSWLAAWLSQMGATVCGFADCVPTSPSHFEAMHLEQHVQDMRGDIRDRDAVVRAMKEFRPDVVFHLAAQALVRKSYEDAPLTFEANMLGTLNMLEAVRQCPSVEAAVFITSDKCYRNDEWVWGYRETDHLGGDDPYSASKGCAEIIAHSYFKSFFKDGPACATVRAGNVIGGGDWAKDRLIPDCIRAMQAGEALTIRNPNAAKPWQYVLDILAGYLCLGQKLWEQPQAFSQAWNFRPQDEPMLTVGDMVQVLRDAYDPDYHDIRYGQPPQHGLEQVQRDESPTRAMLDWHPLVSAADAVAHAARWYQAAAKQNAAAETMAQLQEYQKMCEQA